MKQIYLLSALLCTMPLFSQETKLQRNNQGQVEVTEIVQVDTIPSTQLYFNAKLFFSNFLMNVRETAQIKDEKTKTVATKASFPVTIENAIGEEIKAKAVFTLVIQAKEKMYKYVINDFYFAYTEESGITSYASFNDRRGVAMNKKQWQEVESQAEAFLQSFVLDLKKHMVQKEILCKELAQASKRKKDNRD
jgi:hypothetical protein